MNDKHADDPVGYGDDAQTAAASNTSSRSPGPRAKAPARRSFGGFALLLGLVVGLLVGRSACAPTDAHRHEAGEASSAPPSVTSTWTCSMHPQIRLPEPGDCPICGMDLIELSESPDDDVGERSLVMSEAAVALAEIATAPVERRAVSREVRMVGRVTYDETRMAALTAWVPGRLDRLFVDYTGVTVREGDHLVEIYSPQLIATQKELLQAIKTERVLRDAPTSIVQSRQVASVESARERLRLWGLTTEQIDEIVERGEPLEQVTINAPIGGVVVHKNALEGAYVETGTKIYTIADLTQVWVQLDAYESDLQWLHYGQAVRFSAEASAGREFSGRIAFIEPFLNDRTRTVRVRINVDNADLALKPDMFVRAVVEAEIGTSGRPIDTELAGQWMCPMHPEVLVPHADACELCGMDLVPVEELGFTPVVATELPLVLPRTAPLITGKRAVVYVRVPGLERPTFEGREVTLGPRAGDWYVVADGLEEGEEVVVHGNFKIDSELQIRGKPSMMSASGGPATTGHQHGSSEAASGGALGAAAGASSPRIEELRGVTQPGVDQVFQAQVRGLLAASLELHAALASDASASLPGLITQLREARAGIDMQGLSAEQQTVWELQAQGLDAALAALQEAQGLEPTRAGFLSLQLVLAPLLDGFAELGDDASVALFHCPMAFDGAGGHWLQADTELRNPYFGASMLGCGTRVRALGEER